MRLSNNSILLHLELLKQAEEKLEEVVEWAQSTCEHSNIAECDSYSSFTTQPPIRICLDCGITEEGWGCGYKFLREKQADLSPRGISRDKLYSLRVGKFIRQGE